MRMRNHTGQSTIEYLIVAMAVIAALVAVRGPFRAKVISVMRSAISRVR